VARRASGLLKFQFQQFPEFHFCWPNLAWSNYRETSSGDGDGGLVMVIVRDTRNSFWTKNERNREIYHFGRKNEIHNFGRKMANWSPKKLSNSFTFIGVTIMLLQLGWKNGCLELLGCECIMFSGRPSVPLSVRPSVRDSHDSFIFPRYLQYLLTDFRQTFVTGASRDRDELITFCHKCAVVTARVRFSLS